MSSDNANRSTAQRQARDLRFFLTVPHPCSYLSGREATTLFLDPQEPPTADVYDALTLLGFRRSGANLYRPHCGACSACVSVRIPVEDFTPSRTQRKLMQRNRDITTRLRPTLFDERHYALYASYIRARHADGDMFPPSRDQYRLFLTQTQPFAKLLEFWLDERLIAVAATDLLGHGLSAIYTFFDPDPALQRRSLGVFAVLSQIALARQRGLPHVYLGYWIRESQKMRYKQAYQPLEYLDGGRWQRRVPVAALT
ncbi:arginyltransferase [Salinicola endophyticus]|uniref:Aspartate/glutamate leucyltransferase n=1 Tax=Salinicola endophyticus TaxID=1949083 RepID=A0ABY8FI00_9GAMM|nr:MULTISPECIES: arginyltransferase [Salinicola]WFF42454.1 arginyltransferase [Salinicola endophyticus]